jgi:hypothetical protein
MMVYYIWDYVVSVQCLAFWKNTTFGKVVHLSSSERVGCIYFVGSVRKRQSQSLDFLFEIALSGGPTE